MLEFRDFSYAHQVSDEMLKRAFIPILGQLTCAKMRSQLSSVGGEDG